jgi:hypothetical protein
MAKARQANPGNPSQSEGKVQHHTPSLLVPTILPEGLKVMNAAKAIFAHAERRS